MKLINTPYRIRCELGACKNIASATVRPDRVGTLGGLHLCEECMKQLSVLLAARFAGKERKERTGER